VHVYNISELQVDKSDITMSHWLGQYQDIILGRCLDITQEKPAIRMKAIHNQCIIVSVG